MGMIELLIVSVGLAMDAFAVAICKGLAMKKLKISDCVTVAVWFGGFQALMPLIGYYLGKQFASYISAFDHFVAFGLLVLIGANMIRESLSGEDDPASDALNIKAMLPLAVATSIDALAVGVTFACLGGTNIWLDVAVIGLVTFIISFVGVKIGNIFGTKFKSKAEFAGGAILILLGVKILLEHLGVLPF